MVGITKLNSNFKYKGAKELYELYSGSITATTLLDSSGYRFLVIETSSYSSGYDTQIQHYLYDKQGELTFSGNNTFIDNNGYLNITSITDDEIIIDKIARVEITKIYGVKGAKNAVKLNSGNITDTIELDSDGYRFIACKTSCTSSGYGTQIQQFFIDKELEYYHKYRNMICNSGYFGCHVGDKRLVVTANSNSILTDIYGIN